MKNILIIHTGGTISMLEDKETGKVSTSNEHPLSGLDKYVRPYANINERIEFSLPSPQITPKHMFSLTETIKKHIDMYDGFVITHGTDTLEETAYFLNLTLDTVKPVIVTGAMRSLNEIGSDALYNLISSVRVTISEDAREKGVLVVMNDEIHPASNVTKTSTSNVATFQSPQYGPIGIITKETVLFHHSLIPGNVYPIKHLAKEVYLLTAVSGMHGDIIKAVRKLHPDGLVIEALGQGNLPKDVIAELNLLIENKIPVVLVSRCYQGVVQPTYSYDGGGLQLQRMGVIFTNGLTGPKARIKLMVALEISKDINVLRRMFEEEIN